VPGIVGWSHAADQVDDEATNHRAGRQPPVNVHEEIALPWPPPIPSLAAADTPPATDGFSESALQENERRRESKKRSMGVRELAACALTLLASIRERSICVCRVSTATKDITACITCEYKSDAISQRGAEKERLCARKLETGYRLATFWDQAPFQASGSLLSPSAQSNAACHWCCWRTS
jgi:hypothetical protein